LLARQVKLAKMASAQPIQLYRSLLREARRFPDYQISQYIARRTRDDFRKNRAVKDLEKTKALQFGVEQLELVRRQSVIRGLYQRDKTVIELMKEQSKKKHIL